MKLWTLTAILTLAAAAHAAPGANPSGELGQGAAGTSEPRFLLQLDEMRLTMTDRAAQVADRASGLVINAMGFLGVPYRRGGSSEETGFDCSGFVRAMYEKSVGLILPRSAHQQAAATQVIDKKDLQPGDLVFFNTMRRTFSHVGIYVGDGKFIHSPRSGQKVRVEDMRQGYWQRRFDGARRVPVESAKAAELSAQGLQATQ